jgi:hypothetical protein
MPQQRFLELLMQRLNQARASEPAAASVDRVA